MRPLALDEPPDDLELIGERLLIGRPLADFLAENAGDVRWFGPIVEGGLGAVLGRPESFKTFGMLELGLAGAAGGSWLGIDLGEPRPFVYLAAEKSRATVRDRLGRMAGAFTLGAPVHVIHREGVTFGDRASWDRVREVVDELGPRTFVVADTIASLAGPGFDENSGRDMAVVLAALRQLCDTGATVAACHHPSKHGDGSGGIRLRGHTSLWGEVDGTLEFTRPDRAVEAGIVRLEPKDGDLRLLSFRWDRETFLLTTDSAVRLLTAAAVAAVVDALYDGSGITAKRIEAEFSGHGRSIIRERITEAVQARLIARIGSGPTTAYIPMPTTMRPDDRSAEPGPNPTPGDGRRTISSAVPSGEAGPSPVPIVHREARSSGDRPQEAREALSTVHGWGSIRPPVDDSVGGYLGADDGYGPGATALDPEPAA